MKRWPNRAEVCLKAEKRPSGAKQKQRSAAKTAKNHFDEPNSSLKEATARKSLGFSAACKTRTLQRREFFRSL
jgi:hypothetical protein